MGVQVPPPAFSLAISINSKLLALSPSFFSALLILSGLLGCSAENPPISPRISENPTIPTPFQIDTENAHSERWLEARQSIRKEVRQEITELNALKDPAIPLNVGRFQYRLQRIEGYSLPVLERRSTSEPDSHWRQVLNPNRDHEGRIPLALTGLRISPDQKRVAYTLTFGGNSDLGYLIELGTQQITALPLKDHGSLEWATDQSLWWTEKENSRPARLLRYDLGQKPRTILSVQDPQRYLNLTRSDSGRFLIVREHSAEDSIFSIYDSSSGAVLASIDATACPQADHLTDFAAHLLAVCSYADGHQELRSWPLPGDRVNSQIWYTLPPKSGKILDLRAVASSAALFLVREGLGQIISFSDNGQIRGTFPASPSTKIFLPLPQQDSESSQIRVAENSWGNSPREFLLSADQGLQLIRDARSVITGLQIEKLASPLLGVPITKLFIGNSNQSRPVLLYAYGAYGEIDLPQYNPEWIALLKRGFMIVIAHVRGGGYRGEIWHAAGRKMQKQNSVADFVDVAKWLRSSGQASSIVASGKSAGGLLAAAAINQTPSLFQGLLLDAPFLNPLGVLSDAELPHTPREYAEWGNPQIEAEREYIRSYSPLQNVGAFHYPPVFVTARKFDQLIRLEDLMAWLARVRETASDDAFYGLRITSGASHLGEDSDYEEIETETARAVFALEIAGREENRD